MKKEFPKETVVAYAICECGHKDFVIDGQNQTCIDCGKLMFREASRKYCLIASKNNNNLRNCELKEEIIFPKKN